MKDLILLHGALGADTLFAPLKAALHEHFQVHSFNFSGHGRKSLAKSGFGIKVFADELEAFLVTNQLEKPCVFGYSMGGYVALYLESQKPGTFSDISTLGTKFDWNPEAARHEASRLNPEKIKVKVPAFAQALAARHGAHWPQLLEATATMMTGLGDQPLLTTEVLKSINIPVSICLGDQDNMVSPEESKQAAIALPKGNFILLADTPHPIEKVDVSLLSEQLIG